MMDWRAQDVGWFIRGTGIRRARDLHAGYIFFLTEAR